MNDTCTASDNESDGLSALYANFESATSQLHSVWRASLRAASSLCQVGSEALAVQYATVQYAAEQQVTTLYNELPLVQHVHNDAVNASTRLH
jgi:hypothetical protein